MAINMSFLINFTLLFRSLTDSTRNAGIITSAYSFGGPCAALLCDELGGILFSSNNILPFLALNLPFNSIFLVILFFLRKHMTIFLIIKNKAFSGSTIYGISNWEEFSEMIWV